MKRYSFILILVVSFTCCLVTTSFANNFSIREVQQILQQLGFAPGPADGIMGQQTKDALKKFQQQQNIPQTGRTDQATLQQLEKRKGHGQQQAAVQQTQKKQQFQKSNNEKSAKHQMYAKKSAGDDIKQIQQKLKNLGYHPGPADGVMGEKTRQALNQFQKDQRLQQTGKVDQQTMQALQTKQPRRQ